MKKKIEFDSGKKVFPIIVSVIGTALMLAMWITRLNMTAVICVGFCCIVSALIVIGMFFKRRLYLGFLIGYCTALFGVITYYIIFGADAGFGAFTSGLAGFSSAEHPWLTGEGNFFTRLLGNLLLALPSIAVIVGVILCVVKIDKKVTLQKVLSRVLSVLLVFTTVAFVLTMNLRSKPNAERLWDGQDDYLKGIDKNKTKENSPNVLFILMDDLGYGDLECYGAKNVQTPNVNRLAKSGILFTNAHATAATSTPSRYSMLTGEYAWRKEGTDVAAGNAGMIIRPEQYTMADMFKSVGYTTAAVGKWHLGLGDQTATQDWNAPLPCALGDLGFDYHYIMAATADRVPCVYIENGKVANYDPSAPIEVSYQKNFEGEPTGKSNPELLYNLKPSHGHDMSIVNGISRIGFMKGGGKALWKDENIADSLTTHAIQFIEENQNKPFFLYFATNDVHVPRFPHDRFRGKNPMGLRGDAIVQFDYCVGEILNTLEKLGLRENTLIILSSDNGPVVDDGYDDKAEELLNGHSPAGPLRGNKYSAFEGGTRIPAIVSWPAGVKKGMTSDLLVSQVDWLASLASLTGATMPKNTAPDSYNYLGSWLGKEKTDRPWVIEQASNHTLSVRTKDWKYIEPNDGPKMIQWGPKIETGNSKEPQLYKMKEVKEVTNYAKNMPEKVAELQSILQSVREGKDLIGK